MKLEPPIADPHSTERLPFKRSPSFQKLLCVVFVFLVIIAVVIAAFTTGFIQ